MSEEGKTTTSTLKLVACDFCGGTDSCSDCLLYIYGGITECDKFPAKKLFSLLVFTEDRIFANNGKALNLILL
jgi:hypothetical protein